MASEIVVSFLGAVQASISVLLTIFVGVLATQFGYLTGDAAKLISKLCVEMLMPCLLIVNLGDQLHISLALRYVPILIWSIFYNLCSLGLGRLAVALFKLPQWVVPAVAFNNTTSLPLLLLQALGATGVLSSVLGVSDHNLGQTKSYFLVCAVVSNTFTFGEGPKVLVASGDSEPSDNEAGGADQQQDDSGSGDEQPDETTSLLPNKVVNWEQSTTRTVTDRFKRVHDASPHFLQKAFDATSVFINPPFIGAVIGCIIGLSPPLKRLFFNESNEGGYLNAWLTTTLENVGELFVTLQVLVVGAKLTLALRRMKDGKSSGNVPWGALVFVLGVRFVLWSLISIPLIWALAKYTNLLSSDPMLWFAMMLMPTGPSAMKLLALADVTKMNEEDRMSIAKLLTISYMMTPLISFTVVGALQAAGSIKK